MKVVLGTVIAVTLLAALALAWMMNMPGRSYRGALGPLSEEELAIRAGLAEHIGALAGEIGPRHMGRPEALERAAGYIVGTLAEAGYEVRELPYQAGQLTVRNLEVEIRGTSRPQEIVVIGAHYDSVPGSPGANDNASGVAALVELALRARGRGFARTLRFVAFVNEEPPNFQTARMGSLVYARAARERGERIVAMVSLETLGYYTDAPRSQFYPLPFGLFYPREGNFVAFVGNLGSRDLVRRAIAVFRETTDFPSEGAAAPAGVPGIGWSDHWSFWQQSYPAIMVTDTALYRYPQYHTGSDTPEIIAYERMARVVAGLGRVADDLAIPDQK